MLGVIPYNKAVNAGGGARVYMVWCLHGDYIRLRHEGTDLWWLVRQPLNTEAHAGERSRFNIVESSDRLARS